MGKCVVCGNVGERHHIVFKNQKGFDFPLNYVYLCFEHHRGKNGPHKNRKIDNEYKINMQNKLFHILTENYYTIEEIMETLDINPRQARIITGELPRYEKRYKTNDIIKILMGGKLYYNLNGE